MSRLIKIVIGLIVVIGVLALIAMGAWTLFSRQAIPKTEGTIKVAGLSQPVEIVRDEYGVPHIYAQNQEDLFFAQGYTHAQDRFWQMELQRRTAAGRLSEIFGESSLSTDRYLRHFGFHDSTEQSYAMLDDETRTIVDAYTAGVNAYIADRSPAKLGLEFALLGVQGVDVEVEEWTPVDSMIWAEMMIFDQGSRFAELKVLELISSVGQDMAGDLLPEYRDDRPVIIASEELDYLSHVIEEPQEQLGPAEMDYLLSLANGLDSSDPLPEQLAELGFGAAGASNSFAISGDLTDTGMPLLANDPHMGILMPALWYEVGMHCVQKTEECPYDFRGFSFPGVPGIVIGHNDRIAWGLTNAAFDAEDTFVERINPDNPNQYEVNGKWVDMEIRREEIQVQGQDEPEVLFVRSTRNGIVATDELIDQNPYTEGNDLFVLSFAWTALEPVRSVQALLKGVKAQNWDEFVDALQYFDAGKQNFIYADVDGNIGYIMPGKVPIRAGGDGTLPVPGWNDDYIWTGYIPYEDAPRSFNPEKGYIATANNPQVRAADYPYFIAAYQARGQRAGRIRDMIENDTDTITIEDMSAIHTDNQGVSALEVIPYLADLEFDDPAVAAARNTLLAWDGQNHMDSSEASLYNIFWVHLIAETFHDQLPEDAYPGGAHDTQDTVYFLLQEPDNPWWDDKFTPNRIELRDEILTRAFELAYEEGVDTFGDDLATWRWGDLHTITFRNATLGNSGISIIENIFNRGPFATSGGESIVQKTGWSVNAPYETRSIPALRQVIDLSDLNNSIMIHSVGQSGHPMDPHYDDFIDMWRFFEYHPTNWDRANAESGKSNLLILEPK